MKAQIATSHSEAGVLSIYLSDELYKQLEGRGFQKEDYGGKKLLQAWVSSTPAGRIIIGSQKFHRHGYPEPKRVSVSHSPRGRFEWRMNLGPYLRRTFGEEASKRWGSSLVEFRWASDMVPGLKVLSVDPPSGVIKPKHFKSLEERQKSKSVGTIGEKYPNLPNLNEKKSLPSEIILTAEMPDGSKIIVRGITFARLFEERKHWEELGLNVEVQE